MDEKTLLTPLELKVMNILWSLKKAFVKEIVAQWPVEPAPAYNTVSTIVRILDKEKSYVGHEEFGRSHRYFPLISKAQYQKRLMQNILQNAFSGSKKGLISTLLDTEKLSENELKELQDLINQSPEE